MERHAAWYSSVTASSMCSAAGGKAVTEVDGMKSRFYKQMQETRLKLLAEEYANKRDEALIEFIKTDDDKKIRQLMKSVGTPIPDNIKVFHGGLYKSARYCTRIPEDLKRKAWNKCKKLGLKPYIEEYENPMTLARIEGGEYIEAD